ncbi:hypothetical protein ROS217_12821 [Roseovarius sp. 217]|nr:hypothetical protein ROS217_12821 [Roseovarius sp. 217]
MDNSERGEGAAQLSALVNQSAI